MENLSKFLKENALPSFKDLHAVEINCQLPAGEISVAKNLFTKTGQTQK